MNAIDDYIGQFEPDIQDRLRAIRSCIQEVVPEALEIMSYGIPTFFLKKNLVHFAGYQNHIGFYPGSAAMIHFQSELAGWKTSKGAVQFPHHLPLPLDIIRTITRFRREENLKLKKVGKPGA